MIKHSEIDTQALRRLIATGEIRFGGYLPKKIYGTLRCGSGKRMRRENRVFFSSAAEAIENGFRPCGNCLKSSDVD